MGNMQNLLHLIYPPQCLTCGGAVTSDFALCGSCWRDTPFVSGLTCDKCGLPLPGEAPKDGSAVHCDDCLTIARPWDRGRAALLYAGKARDIVLQLKHADRIDFARPAGTWMAGAAQPLLRPDMLVVAVPLHWLRLVRRKYNQAGLLARQVAKCTGLAHCPDLLQRLRATKTQEGLGRDGRFANLADAIRVHPGRTALVPGRPVLLIDDVMTSGATLAACAEACLASGSGAVSILVLARVAKDG